MDAKDRILSHLDMRLIPGIAWNAFNRIPKCAARIERTFPEEWAINYARSGSIEWSMDGVPGRILAAPVIWWTWPGPAFRYGSVDGKTWDHSYVVFKGSRAAEWVKSGLMPTSGMPFRILVDDRPFRKKIDALLDMIDQSKFDRAVVLLEDIWLDIQQVNVFPASSDPHIELLKSYAAFFAAHFHEPGKIRNELAHVSMSMRHFNRLFKSRFGVTPRMFVWRLRMEEAARRLRSSSEPLKVVAASCGVEDIYHFSKIFKKSYGVPPATYRRRAQLLSQLPEL